MMARIKNIEVTLTNNGEDYECKWKFEGKDYSVKAKGPQVNCLQLAYEKIKEQCAGK